MEQLVEGEAPDVASIPPGNGFARESGPGIRVDVHGRHLIFHAERDAMPVSEPTLHGSPHLDAVQL